MIIIVIKNKDLFPNGFNTPQLAAIND